VKVTVFGTTNCAFCKVEKQWLDSKGVEYKYINIDEDESAKAFLEETLDIQAVPVTTIEKSEGTITHVIHGFDRKKLTEALGLDK